MAMNRIEGVAALPHAQADADVPVARVFEVSSAPSGDDPIVTQGVPSTVLDANGALPPGALCVLADHALGRGLSRVLDHDQRMVTSHMHLEFVRPPWPGITQLVGWSDEIHTTPGSGFARGRIATADGILVALISARFAVLELGSSQGGMVADVEPVLRDGGTLADAHPWTTAPVDVLLGTRIRREASGRVELEFRAAAALANERAGLHGGIGALMGERATAIALRSASPNEPQFLPVELRIVFLRPVPAIGQPLRSDAEVIFLGRSTAATTARLYRADGKIAVQVDAVHTTAAVHGYPH